MQSRADAIYQCVCHLIDPLDAEFLTGTVIMTPPHLPDFVDAELHAALLELFGAPYPGALSELRLRTLVAAYEELNGGEAAHVTLQTLHQLGWVVNLDDQIHAVRNVEHAEFNSFRESTIAQVLGFQDKVNTLENDFNTMRGYVRELQALLSRAQGELTLWRSLVEFLLRIILAVPTVSTKHVEMI